jgi:tetratricopeptide (TPR) repeat protein
MKKILFATLFTFMAIMNGINAQRINMDTLNRLLQTFRADSTKSLIYARLCQEYSQSNPDTALHLAQQGLILARSIGFVHGEAACLNVIAGTFSQTGDYVRALELNLQSLKKAESIGDQEMLYDDMTSVSAAHWNQQDNKKALEYSLKAKNMAIANKMDSSYMLNAHINVGDGFEKNNLLDSARYYGMMSHGLAVKYGDTIEIGGALNVLGNTYSKLKQSDSAMAYFKKGITFSTKANDFGTVCDHYLGIAWLFQEEARDDSSLY